MRRRIGHLLQPQFPFVVIVDAFDFLITSNSDAAVRSDPNIQIFVAVYKFIFQAPRQPRHLIGLVLRKDIKLKFPPKRPDFRQSFCVHSIRRHHDSPLQYLGFPLFRRFRRRLPLLARMGRTGHVMCRRCPDRSHRCWRQRRRHPACQPLLPFQSNEYPNCPSKLRLSPAFSFFHRPSWDASVCRAPRAISMIRFECCPASRSPAPLPVNVKCAAPMGPISKEWFSDRPPILCVMAASDGSLDTLYSRSCSSCVRAYSKWAQLLVCPLKRAIWCKFSSDFTSNLIQGSTGT